MTEPGGKLEVSWNVTGKKSKKRLHLTWRENATTPSKPSEKKGFGTKLIDANIRGELGGSIDRTFDENGLLAVIEIPLNR